MVPICIKILIFILLQDSFCDVNKYYLCEYFTNEATL